MHRALRPGGVLCTQGECLWLHAPLIRNLMGLCGDVFTDGTVAYAHTSVPSYPAGQIGFVLCSKAGPDAVADFAQPNRAPPSAELRYYNAAMHTAALALPQFALQAIGPALRRATPRH